MKKNFSLFFIVTYTALNLYALDTHDKIYVAGHNGLVGSAIVRQLKKEGYTNIITRSRAELDLCDQQAVENFFALQQPDFVFI